MTLSGTSVFICQWGTPDTWTFQVYMLFSAAGKAGFSTLPPVVLYCWEIYLLACCGSVNMTLLSGHAMSKAVQKGTVMYLSWNRFKYARNQSYWQLCYWECYAKLLIPDGLLKLAFCEKYWKSLDKAHFTVTYWGLCWVLQSFIYIIWWWNKGIMTKSGWVLPRKALHVGDTSAGPAS